MFGYRIPAPDQAMLISGRKQRQTEDNDGEAVTDSYVVSSASMSQTRSGLRAEFTDEDRAKAMGK